MLHARLTAVLQVAHGVACLFNVSRGPPAEDAAASSGRNRLRRPRQTSCHGRCRNAAALADPASARVPACAGWVPQVAKEPQTRTRRTRQCRRTPSPYAS